MKIGKKIAVGTMILSMMLTSATAYAADAYENSKSFTNIVLPETSGNTSLVVSNKTTSRSYGRVKITSYTNCKTVSCWFRTQLADGSYHYWTPYIVDINDNAYHKIKYCDANSSYYAKGVGAALRAENADEALNIWTEKVSGTADFN